MLPASEARDVTARPRPPVPLAPRTVPAFSPGAALLVLLILAAAYRIREIAGYSLWLDESWVGLAARAPTLSDFLLGLSVTPVLFVASVRASLAVLGPSDLAARFVPFAFSMIALAVSYRLGKELQGWPGGLLAAILIGFDPVAVDYAKQLKPYSADAAAALAVVWLGARYLRGPSRRNLRALAVVATLAPGFSDAALIANLALVMTLGLHVLRRPRARLGPVAAAGLPVALSSALFFLVARWHVNPALRAYWQGSYLPRDPIAAFPVAFKETLLLLSPDARLGVALALAAGVCLVRQLAGRRPGAATVVGLIGATAVAVAMAGSYPYGDPRTSLYLTTVLLACAGAGLGDAVSMTSRRGARRLALVGLAVFALWWAAGIRWADLGRFAPVEQTGPLVHYLDSHRQPTDLVVVYYASLFPFAYYTTASWTLLPSSANTVGFYPVFADSRIVLLYPHRGEDALYDQDVGRLARLAESRRVWFLMSHVYGDEGGYLTGAFGRVGRLELKLEQPNAILLLVDVPPEGR